MARTRTIALATLLCGFSACASPGPTREVQAPPTLLLGDFEDDYGISYTIDPDQWVQGSDRYRIERWDAVGRYLIVQNDPGNVSAGGEWTRIDWVVLGGQADYLWAFCYAVYDAASADAARTAAPTDRDHPRTGCRGYPFSRMQRR